MELVRYRGDADYSALYVDGVLDTYDKHDVVDKRIVELADVLTYNSNYFMRGSSSADDIASTTDEIEQYAAARESLEQEAAELRRRADELIARASQRLV